MQLSAVILMTGGLIAALYSSHCLIEQIIALRRGQLALCTVTGHAVEEAQCPPPGLFSDFFTTTVPCYQGQWRVVYYDGERLRHDEVSYQPLSDAAVQKTHGHAALWLNAHYQRGTVLPCWVSTLRDRRAASAVDEGDSNGRFPVQFAIPRLGPSLLLLTLSILTYMVGRIQDDQMNRLGPHEE